MFAVTAHALYISNHSAQAVNFQSLNTHRATFPVTEQAPYISSNSTCTAHFHPLSRRCTTLPLSEHDLQNTSHSSCTVHIQPLRTPHISRHWTHTVQHFQSLSTRRATFPVTEYVLNKCFSLCIVLANFHQYIKALNPFVWLSQYSRLFSQSDASNHEFTECAHII